MIPKIRRKWTRNPVTKVKPNTAKLSDVTKGAIKAIDEYWDDLEEMGKEGNDERD